MNVNRHKYGIMGLNCSPTCKFKTQLGCNCTSIPDEVNCLCLKCRLFVRHVQNTFTLYLSKNHMSAIYRGSKLGDCLVEALQKLIDENKITGDLAQKVLDTVRTSDMRLFQFHVDLKICIAGR